MSVEANGNNCRLIAALTIAKLWKVPKCTLTDKWIKMWHTHTHTHTHSTQTKFYSKEAQNYLIGLVPPLKKKNIDVGQGECQGQDTSMNLYELKPSHGRGYI